jgi:predicted 2-oxoglutarate/Fe(II)-dependent dioxygenase YbiX
MRSAGRITATVREDGRTYLDPGSRKTQIAQVSDASADLVKSRLLDLMPELEQHFQLPLAWCRPPQFLAYHVGDFFAAHRDTGVDPAVQPSPTFAVAAIIEAKVDGQQS